jgi:hypothetical protein
MTDHPQNRPLSTADMAAAARPEDDGRTERTDERPPAPDGGLKPGRSGSPSVALLGSREARDLRTRWSEVQIGFVDEPRQAVEQADALVAEVMQRLAEVFSSERAELERQWSQGDDVSTEDLRVALQRYRSFFDRLLTV